MFWCTCTGGRAKNEQESKNVISCVPHTAAYPLKGIPGSESETAWPQTMNGRQHGNQKPRWRITIGNSLVSKAHLAIALWAFGGSQHVNFGNSTSMVTSTGVFVAWNYGFEALRLQRLVEKQPEIKTEMQLWPNLLGDIGAEECWVHGETYNSPQLPQ